MRVSLLLLFSLLALPACNDARAPLAPCDDPPCGDVTSDAEVDAGTDASDEADVTALDVVVRDDVAACVPDCSGRECGDDGCGGVCGECRGGDVCEDGLCTRNVEPPPPDDELSCIELVECLNQCFDEGCLQECFFAATPAAQRTYQALAGCVEAECSVFQDDPERFQECQFTQCGDLFSECFEIDGPLGEADCDESIGCVLDCTSEGCIQGCFFAANEQTQNVLGEMFFCAEEACADDPSVTSIQSYIECAVERCFPEFAEFCP